MWDRFDLMMQPSIWDTKYDDMSKQDRLLNYERDLMLYHQTQSIRELTKQNNNYNETQYSPIDYNLKQLETTLNRNIRFNRNKFKFGSPEYIKYENLTKKILALYNNANYIALNVKGFIWFLFSVIICLGIPALIMTQVRLFKILLITLMILIPVLYLYANHIQRKCIYKANQLLDEQMKFIYENNIDKNKNNHTKKEILSLQH